MADTEVEKCVRALAVKSHSSSIDFKVSVSK